MNMSPQPRPQVSLWNRFGYVAFYDDTAVTNRYRMPIGVFAVIDNEFWTRIVGQSITADTTTDTFIWILENALASRGGKQFFIQDADAAMTGAVRNVFLDTTAGRCLWHLYQNITKALSKELGSSMHVWTGFAWGTYNISRILYRFDGHWTRSPLMLTLKSHA